MRLAHTSVKSVPPPQIGIATGIASISVSVAKLLVLPVWGILSTFGLYLMGFSIVGRCQRRWKLIGRARKLSWPLVEMSSRHLVITTSGFGEFLLPVCIMPSSKVSTRVTGLTAHENRICPSHF